MLSPSPPQALKKEIYSNAMQRLYDLKWIFVPKKKMMIKQELGKF